MTSIGNMTQMRRMALGAAIAATSLLTACGIRLDMHDQPKFKPLRENTFYADGRASRPIVEGTVARGQLGTDELFYTGKINGVEADQFPYPVTQPMIERGRERFNIYCAPCHSRIGDGHGMIVQRGFKHPPDYTEDRLMKIPVGHFVNVMTNGFGSMSEYKSQISISDRWAVAAYIRALQLARKAGASDVPAGTQIANGPPKLETQAEEPMSNVKGTHGDATGKAGSENPEKQ
jgi:mono/diheme cytochrome c family protein